MTFSCGAMARNWNDELAKMIDATPAIKVAVMGSFPEGDHWAMKGEGEITNNELAAFARAFDHAREGDGYTFNGEHYAVTWTELGGDSGKMVGKGGQGGFYARKMRLAVIVALFEGDVEGDERMQTQQAIESIAEYMESKGY